MTVVSHEHQFIFLRTRKTASTSLFVSIARYAGKGGIIAEVSDGPDYGINAANNLTPFHRLSAGRKLQVANAAISDSLKLLRHGRKGNKAGRLRERFSEHMTARDLRAELGDKIWHTYFKFAFERNPWDRVLSFYHWQKYRHNISCSFAEFLKVIASKDPKQLESVHAENWSNWPIYTIDDTIAVDFMARYEDLKSDLQKAMDKAGVAFDGWLPDAKGHIREDRRHYRTVYSEEERSLVDSIFRKEIDTFGYEF